MPWPTPQDYNEAIQNPHLNFDDPELKAGQPALNALGLPRPITGQFASVYRMQCGHREWAIRCFLREFHDQQQRYTAISQHLTTAQLPYTVTFAFLPQGIKVRGQWYPILKMEWVQGDSLTTYIQKHLGNPATLLILADRWIAMMRALRQHGIAHGDLQHGNVLVVNGDFRLVDYDGMYVPALQGRQSHELGHRHYQHPQRTATDFGPFLDNFSAWVIYVSLMMLSIDPSLWQRLDAGEEHLLFRREDFESPRSSQPLSMLQRLQDSKAQSIISHFASLLYLDFSEIPPLDQLSLPSLSPTTAPETSPWWKDFSTSEKPLPAHALPQQGALPGYGSPWLLDHLELTPPVYLSGSVAFERVIMAFIVTVMSAVVYGTAIGLLLPYETLSAVTAALISTLVFLRYRFQSLPEIQQKRMARAELQRVQAELAESESNFRQLAGDKSRLDQDEKRRIDELVTRQHDSDKNERRDIESIDRKMQNTLALLNSQQQSLDRAEFYEIAQALQVLQNQSYTASLTSYALSNTSIPGIGSALKKRLSAQGIRTAADIVNIHVVPTGWGRHIHETAYIEVVGGRKVHVEGIGATKASALLAWRQRVQAQLASQAPQSLPPAHEAAIKAQYRAQRQSLEMQMSKTKQEAQQNKEKVREKSQRDRDALTKQLQNVRDQFAQRRLTLDQTLQQNNFAEKHWTLERAKRQLQAYDHATFAAYLKRIFCLQLKHFG
jgi:hypothetical protein